MYTDIDLKQKRKKINEANIVVNEEQINELKLEMAYWLGKGEFGFELHRNLRELIDDYLILLEQI